MKILSEHFETLDCGTQVAMAVKLSGPVGSDRWAVWLSTDGEQLPGKEVPERYRDRLRDLMDDDLVGKSGAIAC